MFQGECRVQGLCLEGSGHVCWTAFCTRLCKGSRATSGVKEFWCLGFPLIEYPGELKVNLSKFIVIIILVMIPKKVKG